MIDRSDLCEFLRYLTVAQSDDRSRGRPVGNYGHWAGIHHWGDRSFSAL